MKKLALSVLVAATVLGSLSACGKKAENAKEQTKQAAASSTLKTDWPQDAMLDAMLRGHPNSKKVCQDENRTNAFFADYTHQPEDEDRGIFSQGWVFIQDVEFYETSNKTLFIIEMSHTRYIRAFPDITGLKCKER
jgi:hypothetical protein